MKFLVVAQPSAQAEMEMAYEWIAERAPQTAVRWYNGLLKAVKHATKACELSKWQEPAHLESLAAAYAECGKFEEAVKWQKKAIQLGYKDETLDDFARRRLELYKKRTPCRGE